MELVGTLFALWRSSTVRLIRIRLTRALLTRREPELHPLSLEDVLNTPGRPRSGADYYRRHLFIRVLSHTLDHDGPGGPNFLEQIARSSSPEPFELQDKIEGLPKQSVADSRTSSGFTSKFSRKYKSPHKSATIEPGGYDVENVNVSKPPQGATYGSLYATYVRPSLFAPLSHMPTNTLQDQEEKANKTVLKLMQELREGGRVDVSIKPLCVFLFRDGRSFSVAP